MTTVAVRDGIIAADSRETWDTGYASLTNKLNIFTKGRWKGCVIGWSGASYMSSVIMDRLEDKRHREADMVDLEAEGGVQAIILAPDGIWSVNESCRPKRELDTCFAVGFGGQGAYALMKAAEFSAEAAVLAMCKLDSNTGEPVFTLTLNKAKEYMKLSKKARRDCPYFLAH